MIGDRVEAPGDAQRAEILLRRRKALDEMWAVRDKAIDEGMTLWDDETFYQQIAIRRGEDA